MSNTFDELKQGDEESRTNYAAQSNTAEIVGRQLVDIIDKQESEHNDRLKLVTDYNVSANHPTAGIENSNRYLLSNAILKCPTALRRLGQKITFLQKNNIWVTYIYTGTSIEDCEAQNQWIV